MAVLKMQCAFACDSLLPRDRMIITPHFTCPSLDNAQSLTDELAAALASLFGTSREIWVKAYDAQGPAQGNYPKGESILHPNTFSVSTAPRELAMCLSFYADRNVKRQRGRLYIPHALIGSGLALRPTQAQMDFLGTIPAKFADIGGNDVKWAIYSKAGNVARTVTHWWVDNEWDIQRRRGLRSTTRAEGVNVES